MRRSAIFKVTAFNLGQFVFLFRPWSSMIMKALSFFVKLRFAVWLIDLDEEIYSLPADK